MVPTVVIILPFLVAFVLTTWQYVRIDPRRRVFNVRFGLMVGAAAAALGYPVLVDQDPGDRTASWVFLLLSLVWLASSLYLLRRMPPQKDH